MAPLLRTHGDDQLAADRYHAAQAARPTFAALTPAQRAGELIARMDVAKLHGDKAAFLAAQADLKALVEQL
jgi:hypothetical protein